MLGIAILAVIAVSTVMFLPIAKSVRVVADVTTDSVYIEKCYFRSIPPINVVDPDDAAITSGNNVLTVTVVNDETGVQILTKTRTEIGTGTYVIETENVPSSVQIGTQLSVTISLISPSGQVLHSNQLTITYT